MNIEYSLKDLLIEAGKRDYEKIPYETGWQPSKRHIRAIKRLIFLYDGRTDRKTLIKALSITAAAAALVITVTAVKPVREGIAAFFAAGTDTESDVSSFIEPEKSVSAVISEAQTNVLETEAFEDTKSDKNTDTDKVTGADAEEWERLNDAERVQMALDEIVRYGFSAERWIYLGGCIRSEKGIISGVISKSDISYLERAGCWSIETDRDPDAFTFNYFLERVYAQEDEDKRLIMCIYLSDVLTSEWDDDGPAVPRSLKYYYLVDDIRNGLPRDDEPLKWFDEYYDSLLRYARYMTKEETARKYPRSYRLLENKGFEDYTDSAMTFEQKAVRLIGDLLDMTSSVKYGIAVSDASYEIYSLWDEGSSHRPVFVFDRAAAKKLALYYENSADNISFITQRIGIKYVDDWINTFSSMTTKQISDDFVKESKYFLFYDDKVLTNTGKAPDEIKAPRLLEDTLKVISNDGVTAVVSAVISTADGQTEYTFEMSVNGMNVTAGTFITEYLLS